MPQICDMGQTALLTLRRKACWGFFRPKNPTVSAGFEPAILGWGGNWRIPGLIANWDLFLFLILVPSAFRFCPPHESVWWLYCGYCQEFGACHGDRTGKETVYWFYRYSACALLFQLKPSVCRYYIGTDTSVHVNRICTFSQTKPLHTCGLPKVAVGVCPNGSSQYVAGQMDQSVPYFPQPSRYPQLPTLSHCCPPHPVPYLSSAQSVTTCSVPFLSPVSNHSYQHCHTAALHTQNSAQMLHCSEGHWSSPILLTLLSSPPSIVSCIRLPITGRMSGKWLGNFRAVCFVSLVLPFTAPHRCFLISHWLFSSSIQAGVPTSWRSPVLHLHRHTYH